MNKGKKREKERVKRRRDIINGLESGTTFISSKYLCSNKNRSSSFAPNGPWRLLSAKSRKSPFACSVVPKMGQSNAANLNWGHWALSKRFRAIFCDSRILPLPSLLVCKRGKGEYSEWESVGGENERDREEGGVERREKGGPYFAVNNLIRKPGVHGGMQSNFSSSTWISFQSIISYACLPLDLRRIFDVNAKCEKVNLLNCWRFWPKFSLRLGTG